MTVVRALALIAALGVAAALASCRSSSPPQDAGAPPAPARAVPELLPTALGAADYVGAAACAECHQAIYETWKRSPHGQSMAAASPGTVLGGFEGSVDLPDGKVTFGRDGDRYVMEMASKAGREKRAVDVVVASGRQHQLYAVKGPSGALSLLPVVWSTKTKEWLPLSLYQSADLDPGSPEYWGAHDMGRGCVSCHLSESYRRVRADGAVSNEWVDLSINCEACHGPGREHVTRRRAGNTDEVYRDLRNLGSEQEARVCGGCHGFQLKRYVFPPAADGLPQIFVTSLVNDALRADGTQHLTSYQYPAHVLSAGYRQKSLHCKDCHAPHGLEARGRTARSPRTRGRTSSARPATTR